jgi:hypothetical protein
MKKETKMGRKPKDGKTRETVVSFKLADDEIKRINDLADFLDIPKTALIRNLVLSSLEDAEGLKKLGILSIAKSIKKTSEFLTTFKGIKEGTNTNI